jgi:hypothetical protein
LKAERARVLRALGNLRSNKKLAAEERQEMLGLRNEEKETWIEDFVERETAGGRK